MKLKLFLLALFLVPLQVFAQTPPQYVCVSPAVCTIIVDAFPTTGVQPAQCKLYRATSAPPTVPTLAMTVAAVAGPTVDPSYPADSKACQFTSSYLAGTYWVSASSVNIAESDKSSPPFVFESVAAPKPAVPANVRMKPGTKQP